MSPNAGRAAVLYMAASALCFRLMSVLVKVAGESNRENRLAALEILSNFGRHGASV